MDKRRSQLDSVHQKGPKTTLHRVLIVVGTWCRPTGWKKKLGGIFNQQNLECFCLWLHNQRSYRETDITVRFSASKKSRNTLPQNFNGNSGGLWHMRWRSVSRPFSFSEIGDVFTCSSTTNGAMVKWMAQADSAHQIDTKPTFHAVLIAGSCFTRWCRNFWRNFLPSDFGNVLANLAKISIAMGKWMLRLDSSGQKDPEIALEGILIAVEGRFTVERMNRA